MLKNINRTIIISGFVLIVLSISTVVYANQVLINVNNLNVRNGPGLNYATIGQVNQEDIFQAIQEEEEWVKIHYKDGTGWVSKEYVTINQVEQKKEKQTYELKETVYVRYDDANIRSGPSTSYEILDFVTKGDSLQPIRQEGEWLEINWKDGTGFIPKLAVTAIQPSTKQEDYHVFDKKTIVIDAGHGGRDVGAIGDSGSYEKEYTLLTANKIKTLLQTLGANVVLTRKNDNYLTLSGRASMANLVNADAFLSLHYNSTPQYPNARGVSTYYYSDRDQQLAYFLQQELLKATEMDDRGTHFANFQVTRENHRPSALLELGFLSNKTEEENIKSSVFQEKIAKGIIRGLRRYFEGN
ncbi:N-acetylmuramoyl-L-alanine amidase [Aquibacillus albus]|uniref:N-acetylmuramoyl-L-alanine amidase n=1 Tax=Aquibacillus albus TaxID=1168171 RepID=A0ABS2MUK5_9BACI|nr:N-acetylmuramoyl-L-alanine amidase [Aquibacillus albus]MBM7569555.1 N-acetylmuramoyl-L-alanine amidase [Aquibacillus albus]